MYNPVRQTEIMEVIIRAGSNQIYKFDRNSFLQTKRIVGLYCRANNDDKDKNSQSGAVLIDAIACGKGYLQFRVGPTDLVNVPIDAILDSAIDVPYYPVDMECVDFEKTTVKWPDDLVSGGFAVAGESFELVFMYVEP